MTLDPNVMLSAGLPVLTGGIAAYLMLANKVERHHGELRTEMAEVKGDVKRINGNVAENTSHRQKVESTWADFTKAQVQLMDAVEALEAETERRRREREQR